MGAVRALGLSFAVGGLALALCRCGSTTHQYEVYDDSVELKLEPNPADAAPPATSAVVPPPVSTSTADDAPTPLDETSPALLQEVPEGPTDGGARKDAGPQPTGDDEVKDMGKGKVRAIRLWSDGRCRSQVPCPQPMDAHGSMGRYCGEPKPVPCTPKLRKAWRARQAQ
jgi:hypothetical protein